MNKVSERLIAALKEAKVKDLVSMGTRSNKDHQLSFVARVPNAKSREAIEELEAGKGKN